MRIKCAFNWALYLHVFLKLFADYTEALACMSFRLFCFLACPLLCISFWFISRFHEVLNSLWLCQNQPRLWTLNKTYPVELGYQLLTSESTRVVRSYPTVYFFSQTIPSHILCLMSLNQQRVSWGRLERIRGDKIDWLLLTWTGQK